MIDNYEENKHVTFEDYEELTRTLKTPEHPMIDIISCSNNPFNLNDYPEPLLNTIFSPVNDNSTQSSEDFDEKPFDHTEWQIIDPCSRKRRPPRQNEFLELLLKNSRYNSYIRWLDKNQGLFQILLPDQVATLWEKVKNRQTNKKMTYCTFARGLRYYYQKGLMIKTKKKYTFCFNKSINNISS